MDDLTRLSADAATIGSDSGVSGRVPVSHVGRFASGTLFAGRFRIVSPLGRGGMGEVYRADDLRLGQTVALKLLPAQFSQDAGRLAQFHNEVRVARTVSHRNVCRTYDIGDADGVPFLTMEYVDGEDLASLLRRIGRFPQDKAIQVARQICAGLAAAHERGVLHRDLKPANVMIDGEGHVRITDFGLAALASGVTDVRVGTPAYMAPEQLAGKEVTERSDIYSLGLVLFELFTGKRVFEAATLNELVSLHESGTIESPSSIVRDLDPTIERAILRCLEHSPARRPVSALAVSAALPGGDELAAALAAGETPSPEMVAAAGEQSALRPAVGAALVAFTFVMLAITATIAQRFSIVNHIPMPRSIDSLRDRAQDIVERIGYRGAPFDTAYGWSFSREYIVYTVGRDATADPWPGIATGRTGTLSFWYRTSPVPIVSTFDTLRPSLTDPPLTISDMRVVRLDPSGRLRELHSVPPQIDEAAPDGRTPDWAALFDAAGLDLSAFRETTPMWTPRSEADVRKAWTGPIPDLQGETTRVEAAAYRGRPIFFLVADPWIAPGRMATPQPTSLTDVLTALSIALAVIIVGVAALLARHNLRSGRGDRRGAFRTASLVFVTQTAGFLLRAKHYPSVQFEYVLVGEILGRTLLSATGLWLSYVAFEPYVRRFWPQLLIGWNRLISGRVRDPLVGRDVLIGVAAGTIGVLLIESRQFVPYLMHSPLRTPVLPLAGILLGPRYGLEVALVSVLRSLGNALQLVGLVVFLKMLVKRPWLVMLLTVTAMIPVATNGVFAGEHLVLELAVIVSGILLVVNVLLRFGLLAQVVMFYTFLAWEIFPVTTDFSRPYAGASFVLVSAIAALSLYGFYASRGDEPLFGRDLLN